MKVELNIRQKTIIDVPVEDIIDAINQLPINDRLNYIGELLNGIDIDLKDSTPSQIEVIMAYLKRQIASLEAGTIF